MEIKECRTQQDIEAIYPLVSQLYGIREDEFLAYVREMMAVDYRLIAGYAQGKPIAVAGFRVGRRLYCGRYLHIDNLIVDEDARGEGLAQQLIIWLRKEAERLDCDTMLADSYVDNYPAQKLFFKEGFHIRGFHLKQNIKNTYRTTFVNDKPKGAGH